MKAATRHQIQLGGRRIDYHVVRSKAARKLRVRVGPAGVEVVQPAARSGEEVSAFLDRNGAWILVQLERAERLRGMRRPTQRPVGEILFRGESTRLRIETTKPRARGNIVENEYGEIVIRRGRGSRTPV